MTSLFPAPHLDIRERRHGHFFWQSVRKSIYLHIESPRMFDADRWFHFALPAGAPRAGNDDFAQGMEEARAAWLQHAPSMLLSLQSYELRDVLGRSDNRFDMRRMDDHEVAKALYNEVQNGGRQTRDVATALGLNKNQAQQLHREIGGQRLGYHEIMERAKDMFNLW
ncbi:hypothetical protein [Paraburkholderia sp. MM6662-R1]|uniref:hypothetical protein n=1 Tax=Paraburkholderia sp. MM6662-R1 TaxID=2991066 RepID=UPI003D2404C6